MRAEIGVQMTLSLLAHVSVFLLANRFLGTSEIPNIKIVVNTTHVTESRIKIKWKIYGAIPDIASVHVSIFNPNIDDMKFLSKSLENTSIPNGNYTFQHLQSKIKYEACVIARTHKNVEVSGCVRAKTKSSGFSRLKLLTSDNEKNEGLIVFLVFLVLILFIGISAWTYNIYLQRIKAKHINDNSTSIRYRAFENEANENTNTEAALTQEQLEEPLLQTPICLSTQDVEY